MRIKDTLKLWYSENITFNHPFLVLKLLLGNENCSLSQIDKSYFTNVQEKGWRVSELFVTFNKSGINPGTKLNI